MHNATIDALFDELEKIGAAKWRNVVRKIRRAGPSTSAERALFESPNLQIPKNRSLLERRRRSPMSMEQYSEQIPKKRGIADIKKMGPEERAEAIRMRKEDARFPTEMFARKPPESDWFA